MRFSPSPPPYFFFVYFTLPFYAKSQISCGYPAMIGTFGARYRCVGVEFTDESELSLEWLFLRELLAGDIQIYRFFRNVRFPIQLKCMTRTQACRAYVVHNIQARPVKSTRLGQLTRTQIPNAFAYTTAISTLIWFVVQSRTKN